jgi:hypothetical protein
MSELLKMNGYDDCILGVVERFGAAPHLIYDKSCVIKKLMKDGMDENEAVEFYEFNQLGAWLGENTPAFLEKDVDRFLDM